MKVLMGTSKGLKRKKVLGIVLVLMSVMPVVAVLRLILLEYTPFGGYHRLKQALCSKVGFRHLQNWGEMILRDANVTSLSIDRIPPEIFECVNTHGNPRVLVERRDGTESVRMMFGSGFYHYGIVLGAREFVPRNFEEYEKLAEGVWGYAQ